MNDNISNILRKICYIVFSLLFTSIPVLADYTCVVCYGSGSIYYEGKKVQEHKTSMIMPGDPNWMRGYTHYVHSYEPPMTTYTQGGYDTCHKCKGTGINGDTESMGEYRDEVRVSYRPNGEGTLLVVETHSSGGTYYGLADGNKNILIEPRYDHIYPTKNGLVRFVPDVKNGSVTSGLYAVGKGVIIPLGKWPGMTISEDGRLIIAYNVDRTYFFWDDKDLYEGRSVKEWQYKPDHNQTWFYNKVAFNLQGKTFYGLAKGWDKFIFPPIYEDLELLGNRPESGVRVQFNGRLANVTPPYGSIRYIPMGFDQYKGLNYSFYRVEKGGKWGMYDSAKGELHTEVKYDNIRLLSDNERRLQPLLRIVAEVGDHKEYFDIVGKKVKRLDSTVVTSVKHLNLVKSGKDYFLYAGDKRLEVEGMNESTKMELFPTRGIDVYVVKLTSAGGSIYGILNKDSYHSHGMYDELRAEKEKDPIPVRKGDKWGVVDQHGTVAVPCEYDEVRLSSSGEKFMVANSGKWGVATSKNGTLIPLEYDDVQYAGRYYFVVQKKGLWAAAFAKNGDVFTKHKYDSFKRRGITELVMIRKGKEYLIYNGKPKKLK